MDCGILELQTGICVVIIFVGDTKSWSLCEHSSYPARNGR